MIRCPMKVFFPFVLCPVAVTVLPSPFASVPCLGECDCIQRNIVALFSWRTNGQFNCPPSSLQQPRSSLGKTCEQLSTTCRYGFYLSYQQVIIFCAV